ncbi:MAG TPA: TPM domain-containing protein [Bacteroidia bacterium]|jgi:uncharacterized membrane protein
MASAAKFFTEEQKTSIRKAIEQAERNTSGEIRVHIDERCKGDVVECAQKVFAKLKMHHTRERNAVLFYLAVKDRQFAIYGDEGIHEKVKDDFWNSVRDKMLERFKQGQFTEGLCEGIIEAGMQLQKYFPHRDDDKDELSNEVTFNKH